MSLRKFICITALSALPLSASSYEQPPELKSFEFLGCSGDLMLPEALPEAWRLTTRDGVSFLVHHSGACGLEGRNPSVRLEDGVLDLAYEMYSPDGVAIMCLCEYWARFSFGPSEYKRTSVTFDGLKVEKQGTWPE
jgi:hypothetical protein